MKTVLAFAIFFSLSLGTFIFVYERPSNSRGKKVSGRGGDFEE